MKDSDKTTWMAVAILFGLLFLSIAVLLARGSPTTVELPKEEIQSTQQTPDLPDDALVFIYGEIARRTIMIQFADREQDLGDWWDDRVESTSDRYLLKIPREVRSIRFNASYYENGIQTSYMCAIFGSKPMIDRSVTIFAKYNGKVYTKDDVVTWSRSSNPALGCSGLIRLKN